MLDDKQIGCIAAGKVEKLFGELYMCGFYDMFQRFNFKKMRFDFECVDSNPV